MSASLEDQHDYRILQAIASGRPITQRALAGELGVALGLTNLLVRRLARKGFITITGIRTRHVHYLMTPAGWDALRHLARASIGHTVRLYTETREQIGASLGAASARCASATGSKRIAFYGAGDVAEIAYVSLQQTDLTLVAVVDDDRRGRFFGVPVLGREALRDGAVGGIDYDWLFVTLLQHEDVRPQIVACGVRPERVLWL